MPCTAYHHHTNPALPCIQATKPTHKATISQATIAMHHPIGSAPPAATQHQNPSLPHHGYPLPWPYGIMWSKVPPHTVSYHAYHFESNRETELIPLREQLRASLERHEELLVSWENIELSDWPAVVQALQFLMPSSSATKTPNNVSHWNAKWKAIQNTSQSNYIFVFRMSSQINSPSETHGNYEMSNFKITLFIALFFTMGKT